MTNRKWHKKYGLPIDTKIDDLGWPWTAVRSNSLGILRHFSCSGRITAKRMKTDLYCQRRICSPLNVLFGNVYIALMISQGVSQLKGVKQGWDGKKQDFHTHTAVAFWFGLTRVCSLSWVTLSPGSWEMNSSRLYVHGSLTGSYIQLP